jgi:F0F1-type ATP synthase assembly protein I
LRLPQTDESRVHDPLSAGRRLASRATAWQAGAAALVALAFLPLGAPSALSAAVGGGAVVAGGVVAALMALGGGIQPAGMAMGRLLAGVMLKWVVVFAVLTLGLAGFKLPPLPMLVGVLAATLAFVLANLLKR